MWQEREVAWWPDEAPHPLTETARLFAAAVLASAGALLGRLSARLVTSPVAPAGEPRFEFYAEAGAPEGALYVDGRFVGWLPGVSRL